MFKTIKEFNLRLALLHSEWMSYVLASQKSLFDRMSKKKKQK